MQIFVNFHLPCKSRGNDGFILALHVYETYGCDKKISAGTVNEIQENIYVNHPLGALVF